MFDRHRQWSQTQWIGTKTINDKLQHQVLGVARQACPSQYKMMGNRTADTRAQQGPRVKVKLAGLKVRVRQVHGVHRVNRKMQKVRNIPQQVPGRIQLS